MKRKTGGLLCVPLFLVALLLSSSCKKESTTATPSMWLNSYTNIVLGDQNNTTNGNFLKPQTGEAIKIAEASSQQRSLAMMFFTESGGANSFLTFPANGTEASTFGTKNNALFTQVPGGINSWDQTKLNSGMIYSSTTLTSTQFNDLLSATDWSKFDQAFRSGNNGEANLAYKLHYELNPKSGTVFLVQFNGLVRAIICIKSVLTTGPSGGNIRFDMIIEGNSSFDNNSEANQLQAIKK